MKKKRSANIYSAISGILPLILACEISVAYADKHIPILTPEQQKSFKWMQDIGVASKRLDMLPEYDPNEFSQSADKKHSSNWITNSTEDYAYTKDADGNYFGYFCNFYEGCAFGLQLDRQCKGELPHLIFFKKKIATYHSVHIGTEKQYLRSKFGDGIFNFECVTSMFKPLKKPVNYPVWSIAEGQLSYPRRNVGYSALRQGVIGSNDIHLTVLPRYDGEKLLKLKFSLAGSTRAISAVDASRLKLATRILGYQPSSKDSNSLRLRVALTLESSVRPKTRLSNKKEFKGYDCIDKCEGHKAGYDWAGINRISSRSDCSGNSISFIEGCYARVEDSQ